MKKQQESAVQHEQRQSTPGNGETSAGLPKTLRARQPDRDARTFLRMANLTGNAGPGQQTSLKATRHVWKMAAMVLGSHPGMASVTERVIDGPGGPLTLRIFKPRHCDQPMPAFLWCFGGGFVVGDLDTADSVCRNIALAAGCITVAVNYRRVPEHGLEASREDAFAALQWLAENGAEVGIDTARLAVGGDSAGGNLAAALAQETRRRGGPALKMQVLVYPATEIERRFPSYEENIHGNYLLTTDVEAFLASHLSAAMDAVDMGNPWFQPSRARDLSGLAPAVVVTAGFDPIRDDGLEYGVRLRAAGVPVEILHYTGLFHGFINADRLLGGSRDALRRIGEALAVAFRDEPAANRTLEIGDEAPQKISTLTCAVGEVASSTMTAWAVSGGWGGVVFSLLPHRLERMYRWMLKPVTAPVGMVQRRIAARLDRLAVHQTFPAEPCRR